MAQSFFQKLFLLLGNLEAASAASVGTAVVYPCKCLRAFAYWANQTIIAKLKYSVQTTIVIGISGAKLIYSKFFYKIISLRFRQFF